MTKRYDKQSSKYLSLILRHRPEVVGIALDAEGWVDVDVLLEAMAKNGRSLTRPQLDQLVANNDKQRFAFSENGQRIRANQGHSVQIDLALEPVPPPAVLYHGTAVRNISSIKAEGLHKRSRQHVHLSATVETAVKVGQRHGKPVVLTVQAGQMHANKHQFFLAKNGVWLTDHVPTRYIEFP